MSRQLTIDKAEIAEHYYLDKAPGLSLMALPAVAAIDAAARALGYRTIAFLNGTPTVFYVVAVWVAIIVTSALFTAAAATLLYLLRFATFRLRARRRAVRCARLCGGMRRRSVGATVFYGHAVAGACLFIGFAR